jgi:hypothetical protein
MKQENFVTVYKLADLAMKELKMMMGTVLIFKYMYV